MLLAIDMGNTNITLGVYDGQELRFVFRIATDIARMCDQYAADMLAIFRLHELEAQQFEGAIVSSVVPLLDRTVCDAVEMITGKRPLLVGPGTKPVSTSASTILRSWAPICWLARWRQSRNSDRRVWCGISVQPRPFRW